jgi:hypothetical protein
VREVKAFRTYEPQDRVHARLAVTGPGLLRRPEAGIDVMGDGALVPYRGAIFKKRLDPGGGRSAYDAVRQALEARGP